MKRILPLLVLLFPVLLAAEDVKLDQLVTLDGKVYLAVTVRGVEPDGLAIHHESGAAKVPFEQLSEDLQTKYGYDEAAAAEFRKRVAEARRLREAAEQQARDKRRKAAAAQSATKSDKEFAKKVQSAARMVSMEAFQNSRIGLIGSIREGTPSTEPVKSSLGSTVGHKPTWVYRGRAISGVIAATTGAKVEISVDDTGAHLGLPAIEETVIRWEGKAWRIGMIEYVDLRGLIITVPRYTASEKEAAAFYGTHGFGPKSEDVIQASH